mmetsp:Transcript_26255/g.66769  ORF Transcript_26255/g.66769 Transcript_26255/m.66769 type:complete len:573 (+) Transcript_26255:2323-4041(+)
MDWDWGGCLLYFVKDLDSFGKDEKYDQHDTGNNQAHPQTCDAGGRRPESQERKRHVFFFQEGFRGPIRRVCQGWRGSLRFGRCLGWFQSDRRNLRRRRIESRHRRSRGLLEAHSKHGGLRQLQPGLDPRLDLGGEKGCVDLSFLCIFFLFLCRGPCFRLCTSLFTRQKLLERCVDRRQVDSTFVRQTRQKIGAVDFHVRDRTGENHVSTCLGLGFHFRGVEQVVSLTFVIEAHRRHVGEAHGNVGDHARSVFSCGGPLQRGEGKRRAHLEGPLKVGVLREKHASTELPQGILQGIFRHGCPDSPCFRALIWQVQRTPGYQVVQLSFVEKKQAITQSSGLTYGGFQIVGKGGKLGRPRNALGPRMQKRPACVSFFDHATCHHRFRTERRVFRPRFCVHQKVKSRRRKGKHDSFRLRPLLSFQPRFFPLLGQNIPRIDSRRGERLNVLANGIDVKPVLTQGDAVRLSSDVPVRKETVHIIEEHPGKLGGRSVVGHGIPDTFQNVQKEQVGVAARQHSGTKQVSGRKVSQPGEHKRTGDDIIEMGLLTSQKLGMFPPGHCSPVFHELVLVNIGFE